jgi:hypothetical protein
VCAFGLDALEQAVLHEHGVDLDVALRAEGGDEWLDERGLARGVEREFSVAACGDVRGQGDEQASQVALAPSNARAARPWTRERSDMVILREGSEVF